MRALFDKCVDRHQNIRVNGRSHTLVAVVAFVPCRTGACVTGYHIITGTAILTRVGYTIVNICKKEQDALCVLALTRENTH